MLASILLGALVTSYLLCPIWRVIYNVFLHPLAHFPGPWWAGATSYVEAYFDIMKGGQYFRKIEAMHARYGPIVRVSPEELSIRDAEFYEHIYGSMSARRDLDTANARLNGSPTSVISTLDHEHHRLRRSPLLPFFSKQSVVRLEPFIWSRVNLLVEKLKHAHKTSSVIKAVDAYGALTSDVISHYAYGKTFDYLGNGSDLEFRNDYMQAIAALSFVSPISLHFPLVVAIMKRLPQWLLQILNPNIIRVNELRRRCTDLAMKVLQTTSPGEKDVSEKPGTIFEALLSPSMPPEERTLERMTDEGFIITAAGLETTSRFLTNTTTHLLLNTDCLAKLRAELKTVMPAPGDCPPCSVLENLPYLSAVVAEGLRCETIFMTRFPRKLVEPLAYKDFTIPAGANIGCAPYLQNSNADVFPEPERYRPERWIEARERGENLGKYLATFVKGGRMCLGINLAYTEMYLTIAAIFHNFDLEFVDSGLENITTTRGYFFGFTDNYDWGVKFRVKNVLG
ncbi:benzoate 4-monooxygenase cytochrome P450 [Bimuria novae-zelandiae CBS 107.79]|uniref:Benzoate 4-monooxygenase cytochrome P450 n=1 Tax=Bimuria novae-zelandiae CBS 107.79 TaxID=1447943 RepID=A0A6A5VF03_9PLEO|nr:benzoate 4-monooxygenase cytochrome P450 [Bimuria novae-zelandiae CBS 107.79]